MSMRARPTGVNPQVEALQKELKDCKAAAAIDETAPLAASADANDGKDSSTPAKVEFDSLNPTEQSAASLGVSPDAWKPIGFMNAKHYDALLKSNALDDTLARRIEAYRNVATTSS